MDCLILLKYQFLSQCIVNVAQIFGPVVETIRFSNGKGLKRVNRTKVFITPLMSEPALQVHKTYTT